MHWATYCGPAITSATLRPCAPDIRAFLIHLAGGTGGLPRTMAPQFSPSAVLTQPVPVLGEIEYARNRDGCPSCTVESPGYWPIRRHTLRARPAGRTPRYASVSAPRMSMVPITTDVRDIKAHKTAMMPPQSREEARTTARARTVA